MHGGEKVPYHEGLGQTGNAPISYYLQKSFFEVIRDSPVRTGLVSVPVPALSLLQKRMP